MKQTILVVDDNPMVTSFLTSFLQEQYTVVPHSDPKTALAELSEIDPDLVLLDQNFNSQITGLDVLRNLRLSGFYKQLPVILLSSESCSQLRIEALTLGANEVLCKPFNPVELQVRIQREFSKNLSLVA